MTYLSLEVNNMKSLKVLYESAKLSLDGALELFVETNVKLTDWYLHVGDDFIAYIINALRKLIDGDMSDWDTSDNSHIYLKNIPENYPRVALELQRPTKIAGYDPKTEVLNLYILDLSFNVHPIYRKAIVSSSTGFDIVIQHELTHFYDDMMLKGKGHKIKVKNTDVEKYNSFEEINGYTKTIIKLIEKILPSMILEVMAGSNKSVEEEFSNILNLCISKLISIKGGIHDFLDALTDENNKHVYKEIGIYFKEYFKKYYNVIDNLYRSPTTKFDDEVVNYNSWNSAAKKKS